MEIENTFIEGLKLIKLKEFKDLRGSFIKVFNPVRYAIEHQLGLGKRLPRRTLLKFQANHVRKITDTFTGWIVKSIQKSFN